MRLARYRRTDEALGWRQAVLYRLQKWRSAIRQPSAPMYLYSRHACFPLLCRPGTSDRDVFDQIFIDREYRCLDDLEVGEGLVVDCGANVGYSAAWFLSRHPRCKVVAIEPDPQNFRMLAANMAPYGNRCLTLQSAVWPVATGLVMAETPAGDGREWSRRVRPALPGETPALQAVDIGSLLHHAPDRRIAVLKVDIEGAEAEVFGPASAAWLSQVDNLVIELHGPRCATIFNEAIAHERFVLSRCEELTVCRRSMPFSPAAPELHQAGTGTAPATPLRAR